MPNPSRPSRSWGTLLACGLLLLVAARPSLAPHLILERSALDKRELWRLWTSSFVALGFRHLIPNLLLILAAGLGAECLNPARFRLLLLLAPGVLGSALLLLDPQLQIYASPTGLAAAVLAFLVLARRAQGTDRAFWNLLLGLLGLVVIAEFLLAQPSLSHLTPAGTYAEPLVHLVGVACGALALQVRRPRLPWRRART